MFILEIIPLVAIPRSQSQLLTYFSFQILPPGSLVEAFVRNKKTLGIVLRCESLKNLKISLRKEIDFSIKPIEKIISTEPVLSPIQLKTALWLSSKYYAPLGLCLKTVLPPFFNKKKYPLSFLQINDPVVSKNIKIKFVQTKSLKNHHKDYEKKILTHSKNQILLVVPELPYLSYFEEKYHRFSPKVVYGGLSYKKFYEVYKKAASGEPLLVIGTRLASFLPFKNLSLIILDNESNNSSRSDTTPRYDTRELLEYIAKAHGADFIINDLIPRIETSLPIKTVLPPRIPPQFVNLVEEIKSKNFSIFSRHLQVKLLSATENGKKIILFIPRKGYARSLICKGCSETIQCSDCSASMVVHELGTDGKLLKCHHCQKEQSFIKVCPRCKNFMLEYRGLGTQKVIHKLKDFFNRHNKQMPFILELSNDSAPKAEEEQKIVDQFLAFSPAILIATPKIFRWQYLLKVDLMGIINMELSSTFPDFRAEEKTLCYLAILTQMANETIIQGYNPNSPALQAWLKNNLLGFLARERETRKIFSYPPFSELIKLNLKHSHPAFFKEARLLAEKVKIEIKNQKLEKEIVVLGPQAAFISKERGKHSWNIFLKVKNLEMKKRNELLRLVPSRFWQVEVNPKTIL